MPDCTKTYSQDDEGWKAALDAGKEQLGNIEINLKFLQDSGLIVKGRRVLELGCGVGTIVQWLTQQGCIAAGSDISSVAIEYGQKKFPGLPLQVESADRLTYGEEAFDTVLSFDVLEHLFDVDQHLSEVRRVLKTGGFYLFQTPNKYSNALFETLRNRSLNWRQYHPSLHSPRRLRKRLIKNGFGVRFVKMNPVTPFFLRKLPQWRPLIGLVKKIPFTALPLCLQTNLYVIAQKQTICGGRHCRS